MSVILFVYQYAPYLLTLLGAIGAILTLIADRWRVETRFKLGFTLIVLVMLSVMSMR
jgi:hypothetical protein